jgi:hypothetical protein
MYNDVWQNKQRLASIIAQRRGKLRGKVGGIRTKQQATRERYVSEEHEYKTHRKRQNGVRTACIWSSDSLSAHCLAACCMSVEL